jgi:hypothetical protein
MPRLTNSVPKYRRHKQSGQAIVTLNGRDYLLGPWRTKASKANYDRGFFMRRLCRCPAARDFCGAGYGAELLNGNSLPI